MSDGVGFLCRVIVFGLCGEGNGSCWCGGGDGVWLAGHTAETCVE